MASSTLFNSQFGDSQTDENNNPKSKDCLSVKPSRELNFIHSRNRYTADLQLFNKKDEPVLYKIRTTAAKSYIVLPTVGLIPPLGAASIKIHMPTKEQIKERISDKFLIQAFPYNRNDLEDDTRLMNQVFEQYYKSLSSKEFQNTKLRVYFESHTVIEEEMSEEIGSAKHYSPSTTMTRDMPESASSLFTRSSIKKLPEHLRTVLSPPPEAKKNVSAPSEDIIPQALKEEKAESFRDLSFRSFTPETNGNLTPYEKTRGHEQEVPIASHREPEAVKVSRNLRNEFDRDQKRNSLNNITNSLPRSFNSFNSFNDNDVSVHTEISDVKSNMSFSEQLSAYKYKLDLLERKYNEQSSQMARLLQEREVYQKEAQNFTRGPASLSTTADESKLESNNKPQMDIWQLMILCIVCMILGSIFR